MAGFLGFTLQGLTAHTRYASVPWFVRNGNGDYLFRVRRITLFIGSELQRISHAAVEPTVKLLSLSKIRSSQLLHGFVRDTRSNFGF